MGNEWWLLLVGAVVGPVLTEYTLLVRDWLHPRLFRVPDDYEVPARLGDEAVMTAIGLAGTYERVDFLPLSDRLVFEKNGYRVLEHEVEENGRKYLRRYYKVMPGHTAANFSIEAQRRYLVMIAAD